MSALGVLGVELSWLKGEVVIEHPAHLFEGFGCLDQLAVGAFTYSKSHITPEVKSIGRYCSIAEGVRFGHMEHPTNRLSTSSFTYDRGFMSPVENEAIEGSRFTPTPLTRSARPICIGNDVWIGVGAYIRAGVTLGDGCIVGAHAVVTANVPSYTTVAGNPARIVKQRLPAGLAARVAASRWWDYAFTDFEGVETADIDRALARLAELVAEGLQPFVPAVSRFRAEQPAPAIECLQRQGGSRYSD